VLDESSLVSVLIPVKNSAQWIEFTIQSVFNQTYKNIEIIIVDDDSTDGTAEIVNRFACPTLRLIRSTGKGAAAARNCAFAASSGSYVQFLDADDLISPDKISTQINRLRAAPDAIAMCPWGRFANSPKLVKLCPTGTWQDLSPVDWLVENWAQGAGMFCTHMWLLPRAVILKAGLWREDLSLNDDGEFFTRIVLASSGVLFCPDATAYYRSGNTGTLSGLRSADGWRSGFEAIRSCIEVTRKVEDSERVRRCGSLLWQVYAHSAYPHQRSLANEALQKAQELHDIQIEPDGGKVFHLASAMLGWKAARVLQKWSGRA